MKKEELIQIIDDNFKTPKSPPLKGAEAATVLKSIVEIIEEPIKPSLLAHFKYPDDADFRPFPIFNENGVWKTGLSAKDLVRYKLNEMKTYYVSPSGSDNPLNGLTQSLSFKTISYAISQGARKIVLVDGIYRSDCFGNITNTTGDDIFVIGQGSGKTWINASVVNNPTFTITASNTYSATVSNIAGIIDYSKLDENGYPLKLKLVASQSLCEAEAGTAYLGTSTIYVHLTDNRVPDTTVHLMLDSYKMEYGSDSGTIYVEGVSFVGGASPFYVHGQTTTSTSTLTALFKDVNFIYGKGSWNGEGEGLKANNIKLSWLENCIAYANFRDGFNYKSSDNPTPMRVIEINSDSFLNTNNSVSSDINGSSAHNGARVIRINGNYYGNGGPNIADVDQSLTICIGTKAWDSRGFGSLPILATRGDFVVGNQFTLTHLAKMYLIGVRSGDEYLSYSTQSEGGGEIVVDSLSLNVSAFEGDVYKRDYTPGSGNWYVFNTITSYPTDRAMQGQFKIFRAAHQIILGDASGNDRGQLSAGATTGLAGFIQLKASDATNNYQTLLHGDGATQSLAFGSSDIDGGAKLSFPASSASKVPFRFVPGGSLKSVILEGGVEFVGERLYLSRNSSVREKVTYQSDLGATDSSTTVAPGASELNLLYPNAIENVFTVTFTALTGGAMEYRKITGGWSSKSVSIL